MYNRSYLAHSTYRENAKQELTEIETRREVPCHESGVIGNLMNSGPTLNQVQE
jgi:hypothetical protein